MNWHAMGFFSLMLAAGSVYVLALVWLMLRLGQYIGYAGAFGAVVGLAAITCIVIVGLVSP